MWNLIAGGLGLLALVLIVKIVMDQRARAKTPAFTIPDLPEGRPDMSMNDVAAGHADLWTRYFQGEGGEIVSRQGLPQEMEVWREGLKTCLKHLFGNEDQDRPARPMRLEEVKPALLGLMAQRIQALKVFETSYLILTSLDDPKIRLNELSHIIMNNPLLSGKILRCANSAYFGLHSEVRSVPSAILILGLVNLKNIVYREHMVHLVDLNDPQLRSYFNLLWEHLTLTSVCCSHVAKAFDGVDAGTLFTMGLLHDLGKFIIATSPLVDRDPDESMAYDQSFSVEDENDLFGINHTLAGKLIAQEWHFPELVAQGLEHHHAPGVIDRFSLGLGTSAQRHLTALYVADKLASVFSGLPGKCSESLHYSYHDLVNRKRLEEVVNDPALLQDVKKALEMAVRTARQEAGPAEAAVRSGLR